MLNKSLKTLSPVQERIRTIALASILITGGMAGVLVPWSTLFTSDITLRIALWWIIIFLLGAIIATIANGLWRLQTWSRPIAVISYGFASILFAASLAWSVQLGAVNSLSTICSALGLVASIGATWFLALGAGVAEAFELHPLLPPKKPETNKTRVKSGLKLTASRKK